MWSPLGDVRFNTSRETVCRPDHGIADILDRQSHIDNFDLEGTGPVVEWWVGNGDVVAEEVPLDAFLVIAAQDKTTDPRG